MWGRFSGLVEVWDLQGLVLVETMLFSIKLWENTITNTSREMCQHFHIVLYTNTLPCMSIHTHAHTHTYLRMKPPLMAICSRSSITRAPGWLFTTPSWFPPQAWPPPLILTHTFQSGPCELCV